MHRTANVDTELNEYQSYLRLSELLSLQVPVGDDSTGSETLFIAVHQACELNFRALIKSVGALIDQLDRDDYLRAVATVKIVNALIESVIGQTRTLDHLSTPDFLGFRPLLGAASGFQSVQFQTLQVLLKGAGEIELARLEEVGAGINHEVRAVAEEGRCVAESLERCRLRIAVASWASFLASSGNRDIGLQAVRVLVTSLLDMETLWFEWKAMHFNLVGRHIGFGRKGTGGTDNSFLLTSLAARLFPSLWEPRT